jgi:5'(3')-deoxyribonucleotidase
VIRKRKRVLLDCDGVLADFVGGFLKLVNARFGTSLSSADVTCWDIAEALGWSRERAMEAYGLITECDQFAAKLDVLAGAVSGVRRLREVAEVYIVTSPWWSQPTWLRDRTNWLHKHFGITANNVVYTGAKHLIVGDVLVDDKTSTCEAWRAAHPGGVAVQWSTPHNLRDRWDGPSTLDWNFLIDEIIRAPDVSCAATVDQPAPVANGGAPIADLVRADIDARVMLGMQRYGTKLHAHNGRDALVDLYQELIDAVFYARQEIEERRSRKP